MRNSIQIVLLLCAVTFKVAAQTIDWSQKANPYSLSINSVAFKSDGEQVLSGTDCHPASIRIYNSSDGLLKWDYEVGSAFLCIMGVAFSSNSQYIVTIEEFGNILIFNNSGLLPVIKDTITTNTSYGFATCVSPDNSKVAVACSNGKVKIYDILTGVLIKEISNAHSSWVTTIAYSFNGVSIVSGGSDDKVKIWDVNGNLKYVCSGHAADITQVRVTPDNNFVISSAKDGTIKVWDINNGMLIRTISGHTSSVNGIDISPNGKMIASASSDSSCKIWNLSDGTELSTFGVRDSGAINTIAWSPNGNKIATGNRRSDIVLWSVPLILGTSKDSEYSYLSQLVYPNPATDYIKLSSQCISYQLFDNKGDLVIEGENSSGSINLQKVRPGFFVLKSIGKDGRIFFSKIIKN